MAASIIRRMWAAMALAALTSLGFSGIAWAESATEVRTALANSAVRPTPLFPASLPGVIKRAQFRLAFTSGGYDAFFTRCCARDGSLTVSGIVARASYAELQSVLGFERRTGHPVSKSRMRHRTVYFFRGDVGMGYIWHEQSYTYDVGSHYFGRVTQSTLATMVRSMTPA